MKTAMKQNIIITATTPSNNYKNNATLSQKQRHTNRNNENRLQSEYNGHDAINFKSEQEKNEKYTRNSAATE